MRGGYGRGGTCNATIDPGGHDNPTFWFDPNILKGRKVPANSPFVNWISISDRGDLWVGDFFTTRILHYARSGKNWKFVDRITFLPWNYFYAISDPTRLFSGPTGFLEYRVNYSVPLQPGDPEVNGDNGAWDIVRNWLPCIEAQLPDPNSQYANSAILTTSDGNTLLYPNSQITGTLGVALLVPRTGVLSYKMLSHPLSGYTVFDPMGNYYGSTVSSKGSHYTYTVQRYALTRIDADGFPEWGAATPIGTYTADIAEGNPQLTQAAFTWWPSSGSIIPVYSTSYNAVVSGTTPAFHLGGLPIGGHALQWQTMPQKTMEWVDGDGSFPAVDLARVAQAGANTFAINRDIFTFYNGNWSPWSCQFSHFRDDGLFLGQFGFRTSYGYGHDLDHLWQSRLSGGIQLSSSNACTRVFAEMRVYPNLFKLASTTMLMSAMKPIVMEHIAGTSQTYPASMSRQLQLRSEALFNSRRFSEATNWILSTSQLAPWPGHRQRLRVSGIRRASTNNLHRLQIQARGRPGCPQGNRINLDTTLMTLCSATGPVSDTVDERRSIHHIFYHEISFGNNDMCSIPERKGKADSGLHACRKVGAACLFNSSFLD